MARLIEACQILIEPTPKTTPSVWAANNRRYAETTGYPGPRDPYLTPYVVPITDAAASGLYKRVTGVMGAQMGKTDGELDLIGHRLDQRPAPILYVGPTKDFVVDQFEPRLITLLDEAPTLKAKVARGKRSKKTRKLVAGVPVRLAYGGSSSALKSDPAALAIVDEYDEMLSNIKGQGDPLGLIEARGFTYAEFVTVITSTPSRGLVETEIDPVSGLELWSEADTEELESGIWKLWQEGTRYHWTLPCPHCGEYFVPRFKNLCWPKNSSPAQARRGAYIQCPQGCADPIVYEHLPAMNAAGRYVAPGQTIERDGIVRGDPPDSSSCSFWVSGLASPFVSWGERAEKYLLAKASGESDKVQTAVNAGFGECYTMGGGGDIPEWEEVRRLALPYQEGDVPDGVLFLTAGVDVQKNRLVYVVRGWGVRQESWKIASGELWGTTSENDVWLDLDEMLSAQFGGLHILRTFVDAGFRPGKKELVPEHKVYEFARRHRRTVFATKGFDTRPTPLSVNRIEVTPKGGKSKYGLDLVRLSTDFFKSWVHERLRWPEGEPGGWHLPADPTEDYCRQIVSEARVRKPNGGVTWVAKHRNNHYLDCEALAYAAAYMLGAQRLKDDARRPAPRPPAPIRRDSDDQEKTEQPERRRDPWTTDGRNRRQNPRRERWL
ncbi:terminase gpA endonuclease subunit [Hyphomicrobium sulfonivorans]|uniref:terminase gpA endonuclease subunit n=1 Tax=Hyphomicrobium sulfonivorans TaxID=121290 RepID=UPI00156FF109|nr:terminase gpA endonuclease subunit [Hyphomicrobium sulfonivorans]MBI1649867.1 phage terminase large subunit family protein [Hyphomicrobium sulfonivorans]NSL71777.1 terminase [Hyphomicrobium sulfonivorans]